MPKRRVGDHGEGNLGARSRGRSCELIKFVKGGIEEKLSLVAIPIIVKFKEIVPTTHFEAAMFEFNGVGDGMRYLRELGPQVAQLKLFSQLFLFDELAATPIHHLKRRCISLYSGADNGRSCAEAQMHGKKRASIFLRYLVGCKNITQNGDWFEQAIDHGRFQESAMCSLERSVGRECAVGAIYKNSFYAAVYAGMWRYQTEKLDYVSRNVLNSVGGDRRICAKVVLQEHWPQSGLTVGFFLKDRLIDGRNYFLRMRPEEDAIRCLHRVKSKIEESGIFTIAQYDFTPSSEECKKRSGKIRDMPPIIIPI